MYATFNRFEVKLTLSHAEYGYHQGQCDESIAYLRTLTNVKRELAKLDAEKLKDELREYGAWDDIELSDHDTNLSRILWLACADIVDSCAAYADND